ncbi:hypothetical protein HMPREF1990_02091 [Porphyromonas gingivalis W4087]|nr:hypothetical protein HMPREF1990_02091 [Porphyromonas gingivalis W4087]
MREKPFLFSFALIRLLVNNEKRKRRSLCRDTRSVLGRGFLMYWCKVHPWGS